MQNKQRSFNQSTKAYLASISSCFDDELILNVEKLAKDLLNCWQNNNSVYICGNGGSAANAMHLANDLNYGIGACGNSERILGMRVEALSANTAIITCLANDTGYENIYSDQIKTKGNKNDLALVLSGSGNSQNIVSAIEVANSKQMKTWAILGFDGGKCKNIAQQVIHFKINDMQLSEDLQLIVGHICMQWLSQNKPLDIRVDNKDVKARK